MSDEYDIDAEMGSLFSVHKSFTAEELEKINKEINYDIEHDPNVRAFFESRPTDEELEGMYQQYLKEKGITEKEDMERPVMTGGTESTVKGQTYFDLRNMDPKYLYEILDMIQNTEDADRVADYFGLPRTPGKRPSAAFINDVNSAIIHAGDPAYGLEKKNELISDSKDIMDPEGVTTEDTVDEADLGPKYASIQSDIDKVLSDPSSKGGVMERIKRASDEINYDNYRKLIEEWTRDGADDITLADMVISDMKDELLSKRPYPDEVKNKNDGADDGADNYDEKKASADTGYDLDSEFASIMRSVHSPIDTDQ